MHKKILNKFKDLFNKESIKNIFKSRSSKAGFYSVLSTILVIVVAVAAVLVVNELPNNYTKVDLTTQDVFTISDQTKSILSSIEDEITVYYIVQSENEDPKVEELLERYSALSDKLTVVKRDPVLYPNFHKQYTDENINENSLIVVCGERFKIVDYYDIYYTDTTGFDDVTGDYIYDTYFAGEGGLTSAIDYVMRDDLPQLYVLEGHGEAYIDSYVENKITQANYDTHTISLATGESIPDDCDCLLIYAPATDISVNEKDIITKYLDNGGNLMLITFYSESDQPNLDALAAYYGVEKVDGFIIEEDTSNHVKSYPYYLLPEVNYHEITYPLQKGNYHVFMPISQGLKPLDNIRETVQVTEILTTSKSAFSKVDGYAMTTYEKEDKDIEGPFATGVVITDKIDETTQSKIVWLTTNQMFDEGIDNYVSGANMDLLLNSLNWMCDKKESISIHAKVLTASYLAVPSSHISTWGILLIGIVPISFIVIGIVIWVRRKNK